MRNCVFNAPAGVTIQDIAKDNATTPPAGFDFDVEFVADNNSVGTTAPTGFNKAEFTGWSWADNQGLLSDF